MTTRRLSKTERANAAPLPTDQKWKYLRGLFKPFISWNYLPVKNNLPAIMSASGGLFGELPAGKPEELLRKIGRECKTSEKQETANVAIARALVEWCENRKLVSRLVSVNLYKPSSGPINFTENLVLILESKAWLVNFDFRASLTLTKRGQEFVHSTLSHTALQGDLAQANVAFLHTASAGKGKRKVVFLPTEEHPKYTLDQVDEMNLEVDQIYEAIIKERRGYEGVATGTDDLFATG